LPVISPLARFSSLESYTHKPEADLELLRKFEGAFAEMKLVERQSAPPISYGRRPSRGATLLSIQFNDRFRPPQIHADWTCISIPFFQGLAIQCCSQWGPLTAVLPIERELMMALIGIKEIFGKLVIVFRDAESIIEIEEVTMVELVSKFPVKTELKPVAVGPYGSWYPFESLRRSVDRLLNELDWGFPTTFGRPVLDYETPSFTNTVAKLPVDVTELSDGYQIKAELPGVDVKDIEVKIVNGGLLIKGVKKEEEQTSKAGVVSCERSFGTFERFFRLPDGVALDKITATYTNGVVTVMLPKTIEAKKEERTITVKAA
jgi:HSP20 family protein